MFLNGCFQTVMYSVGDLNSLVGNTRHTPARVPITATALCLLAIRRFGPIMDCENGFSPVVRAFYLTPLGVCWNCPAFPMLFLSAITR